MRALVSVVLVTALHASTLAAVPPTAGNPLPEIDISASPDGIVPLPANTAAVIRGVFVNYTKVVAPNGRPIHILAQDGWSHDRIVKARNVLEHILRPVPGSRYGADKRIVANAMAENRATLTLFNTEPDMRAAFDGPLQEVDLRMQDLRANEAPFEGESDYMDQRTRDASFEEVLHLVHDTGIKPALPQMQDDLRTITNAAIERGLWQARQDDLDNEPNEYFAAIYDNYLDLWTVPPTVYEGRPIEAGRIPEGTSHFGIYGTRGRAGLRARDADGLAILQEFFPPFLTYTPELPAEFSGTFSLAYDPELRYTAKSQHLTNVGLRGSHPVTVIGNGWDNNLTGNDGDNTLRGNGGDDLLDGGAGVDTAVYAGSAEQYHVIHGSRAVHIIDTRVGRDGSDVLLNIEKIAFGDQTVQLRDLAIAAQFHGALEEVLHLVTDPTHHLPTRIPDGHYSGSPLRLETTSAERRHASSYEALVGLFEQLRDLEEPPVVDGVPDYSVAAMARRYSRLGAYQERLAAIDPSPWPVAQQIDFHLVRAEMNGLEFQHRVLSPWSRDPGFYNEILPRPEGLEDWPLSREAADDLAVALRSVPGILAQARANLDNLPAIAGDLATLAVLSLGDTRATYEALAEPLQRHHPEMVPLLHSALGAIDDYTSWIETNQSQMTARAGVGKDNYNWLLKNVYLLPYTWDQVRTIVELEDNRVITFQRLEEHRNRDVPAIEPVHSQAQYKASVAGALDHIMESLRREQIFTLQDTMTPDGYFGSWHGFDKPWPDKPDYFFNFSYREPVMEETHEMVGHYFDELRAQRDDRPIRGGRRPFKIGTARSEGFAFALEELLMHAGILDGRNPHGREIAYEQAAFRTVRALSDIYMHSRDWSLDDAIHFCVSNAPHGELLAGSHHLWFELDTTLRGIGHHMLMVVGKVQFMKLFRDRANQLGKDFDMRGFFDQVLEAGVIPWSLIRWEVTGYDDEIRALTSP